VKVGLCYTSSFWAEGGNWKISSFRVTKKKEIKQSEARKAPRVMRACRRHGESRPHKVDLAKRGSKKVELAIFWAQEASPLRRVPKESAHNMIWDYPAFIGTNKRACIRIDVVVQNSRAVYGEIY
jgi:hypothetical protein